MPAGVVRLNLDQLRADIALLRQSLLNHPIYQDITSPAALRTFMEHHVFAVWDFMSLLKALQQRLCCVAVPWLPAADANAGRLINEIVLGEESDEDGRGGYASHFELYHDAMRQFGASTVRIDRLLELLRAGQPLDEALHASGADAPVRRFVGHTFAVIRSQDLCAIASAFTFGREDLLPDVFRKIVDGIDHQTGGNLGPFKFYLQRHIDLDSGEHGPMAMRLILELCGNDPQRWESAREAAVTSLRARVLLWDAIHRSVLEGGGVNIA